MVGIRGEREPRLRRGLCVFPGALRQYLRQLERKPAEIADASERRDRAKSPYFKGELRYFFGFSGARGLALFLLRM
jgi:hypothetical protein